MSARVLSAAVILALFACVGAPGAAVRGDDRAPRATLTWKSKDDGGLYGYLVYRSDSREGPFRRINRDVVHVVPANAERITQYTFVDTEVVPGRTYYYYLDTLGTDGRKRRFSGVVAKTVAER